jgi:hypothetical protein
MSFFRTQGKLKGETPNAKTRGRPSRYHCAKTGSKTMARAVEVID